MAVTAKFIADFSSFNDAVDKADVQLRSFESSGSRVETSLTRMANSLSGTKLIQDATLMAAAVDKVGGVTSLTEKELEKLSDQAKEAAAKMQALGLGVPENLQKIIDAGAPTTSLFSGLTGRIAETAAGFISAQAIIGAFKEGISALSSELQTLTLHGAAVDDVAENFAHLTANAGVLGDKLLGTLRQGTHGTIDDFELMKGVNQDLAAGLNLTDVQFGTLSKGAFALAQATGGDVKTALETMNDAMVTGRTKALALLTGKIDLTDAEKKFAEQLGTTKDHLSDEGKLEAARAAILDSVSAATARLGEQTDGLDERVAQAQTAWANFENELGRTIATSPVIMAGLDGIRDALQQAFGGKQDDLVRAIASRIDDAAIALVDFAQSGLTAVELVEKSFHALQNVFGDTVQVISGLGLAALYLDKALIDLGAHTGKSVEETTKAWNENDASIQRLLVSMRDRGAALQAGDAAQDEVTEKTNAFSKMLDDLKAKMEAAKSAHEAFVGPINQVAEAEDKAGAAADRLGKMTTESAAELAKAKADADKFKDAMIELESAGDGWRGTLDSIDGAVVEAGKAYLAAGVSQNALAVAYGLTAVQAKSLQSALAEEQAQIKLEQATIEATTKLWDDYFTVRVAHGGTAIDQQRAQIERWYNDQAAAANKAGIIDAEYWDALEANAKAKLDAIGVDWQALSAKSRAALESQAQAAEATFQKSLTMVGDLTDQDVRHFQDLAVAARAAADAWGSGFEANAKKASDAIGATNAALQQTMALIASAFPTVDSLNEAGTRAGSFLGHSTGDLVPTTITQTPFIPQARASGGPVSAGQPYVVGEKQPELFVPQSSGTILPSLGGGTNITIASGAIVLNYPLMNDPRARNELASMLGDALMSKLTAGGLRLPSRVS